MDITIYPAKLQGELKAIPSKSHAHRLLICAAFSDAPTTIDCAETSEDIEATVRCLNTLGANISRTGSGYHVLPVQNIPHSAILDCGESGSTLRFVLPIICALGIDATIIMSGRLPYRPLTPLWDELSRMGCKLSRLNDNTIHTCGKLRPGVYKIAGNISSQFISGLLFALSIMEGDSRIEIAGRLESAPYVAMTCDALSRFGVKSEDYHVHGSLPFHSPGKVDVEGDWSNSAFFLVANALGNNVTVRNLSYDSCQGDRVIADILKSYSNSPVISMKDIPDLMPILAVYFASHGGAVFTDITRLRWKESDRVDSVAKMLYALGIEASIAENALTVSGSNFTAGTIDACNDHRIAMSAAIAATTADGPVTILGAECVAKSYPSFWEEYKRLGGKYEQYIR